MAEEEGQVAAINNDLYYERTGEYVEREPGVKLYYERHGSSDATHKVLFIMGLATSHKSWEAQVNHFKALPDFQICVFDNRGVGFSSSPPGPYTMKLMADDAIAVADCLGWEKFHLVGVSMGGMISQHVALAVGSKSKDDNNGRLLSLTLIATRMEGGFWNRLPPIKGAWGLLRSRLSSTVEGQISALLETLFPLDWLEEYVDAAQTTQRAPSHSVSDSVLSEKIEKRKNREWVSQKMLERRQKMPQPALAAVKAQIDAINGHGLTQEQISIIKSAPYPKLVLTGDIDHLVHHSHSLRMKDLIEAELVLLPGVGHGICEQAAEKVNSAIHNMITTVK